MLPSSRRPGGARRRPRGAGDRQHRQRPGLPDRPRRRASWPRTRTPCGSSRAAPSDAELRLTAWHNQVWKPVIAAVNGICAGGGLHFVADADIVIASTDATFLDPHVSVGQVTALRGDRPRSASRRWRRSPAWRCVGRHERITAERARQLGILSEVVDPPERLRDGRPELAEMVARNSPAAMAATKRALWGALEIRPHRRLPGRRRRARRHVGPPRPGRRARWPAPRSETSGSEIGDDLRDT